MEREEVLNKVLAFLTERLPADAEPLMPASPLRDVVIDSLGFMDVVMFLEEDFGLSLERADLDHIVTPESITSLILRKRSGTQ